MSWYEVYLDDIAKKKNLKDYVDDKIKNKRVFICLIRKYAKGKNIIESGSGTGVLSTYMASLGYNVIGVDIDKEILELSRNIALSYGSLNKPTFKNESIFKLNYEKNTFDVSFSNGVLEHFNDEQIIKTLQLQMKVSKIVIFGIPTKYFNSTESMYGDERYMSFSFWREIINKAGGKILEEKNMHFKGFFKRLKDYKKFFKPYPFRIFVIEKSSDYE